MNSDITVYYENSTQSYSIYITNKTITEAHTSAGKGVFFELSANEAEELCLKLAFEEQLGNMTQEEANKEQVLYDERGKEDDY